MRALASQSWGCKANSYVLVLRKDLQPTQAEWKDIGLWRRERRVERVVWRGGEHGICPRLLQRFFEERGSA